MILRTFCASVVDHPKKYLLALGLVTVGMALFARKIEFDASVEAFIRTQDPDYARYKEYNKRFGREDTVLIAFEDPDLFSARTLEDIRRLTRKLEEIPRVFDVRSLTNIEYIRGTEEMFESVPLVEAPDMRSVALSRPLIRGNLVSEDGRKTAVLVNFKNGEKFDDELSRIEAIVREESAATGRTIHISGEKYVDHRIYDYIRRDVDTFVPVTLILVSLLLFVMFRSVRETLIGISALLVSLTWVQGLMPLFGWKMDSVTAGVPSLVLCIAVTDIVHILHRYREQRDLKKALEQVVIPCFLTGVTTAIGFGSLMFNEIRPIQGFGMFATLGLSCSFIVCIIQVPALLSIFGAKEGTARPLFPNFLPFGRFVLRRKAAVFALAAGGLATLAAGSLFLTLEADRKQYLRRDSDVYQALSFIDANLSGTAQLDVYVEGGREGAIKEPAMLRRIEALSEFLRAQPEVLKVVSINDFIKEMNRELRAGRPECYALPETRQEASQLLWIYSMSGTDNELDRHYMDYAYSTARVHVRIPELGSEKLNALIQSVQAYLRANFPEAQIASATLASNNVFLYMMEGLTTGLGIATLMVWVVLSIAFRSVYVGFIALLPNILPSTACLGILGWLGAGLNISTAMAITIGLGIAVDDTIHLIARFNLERKQGRDRDAAILATLGGIGSAAVEASLVIIGGFLVLTLSSLRMNAIFGLFCAFIMFICLAADLLVTPMWLMLMDRQRRRKAEHETRSVLVRR